jgi:D-serine deaminase-like pyridoxal phosphate-dependent protein
MTPSVDRDSWYELTNVSTLPSPALLVYRSRVEENVSRMLALAGGPERLRPHIKTHKIRELLELQLKLGITKYKCATIAEAELAASAGVSDLLLAYQPVGPTVHRLIDLVRQFQNVRFSVIADDPEVVRGLSSVIQKARLQSGSIDFSRTLEILVDLDIGQHRTGIVPGIEAFELYRFIASLPGVTPGGLHAYDGHISDPDPGQRAVACERAFAPVETLRCRLEEAGLPVPRVVAGGTPTFKWHAKRNGVECSPGTCVLWDAGYASKLQDLQFAPAALVLTRVVSKPGNRRLCLDLGHKAVASEMPQPRVRFLNLDDAHPVMHSEEHLVVETDHVSEFKLGDCLYGIPWHICPTVALHSEAIVIEGGRAAGVWKVAARERRLTV